MARRPGGVLKDVHKAFVVQRLAMYDTPGEVAAAVNEHFGIRITPQACERYDPTKRAGERLSQQWRDLFETTRKNFLEHVEVHIPEANKAVRIRHLANAARALKGHGNLIGMADMLERIAKEMGNVHTNRRELTGADGKPIEYRDLTEEQVDRELATLLTEAGLSEEEEEVHALH